MYVHSVHKLRLIFHIFKSKLLTFIIKLLMSSHVSSSSATVLIIYVLCLSQILEINICSARLFLKKYDLKKQIQRIQHKAIDPMAPYGIFLNIFCFTFLWVHPSRQLCTAACLFCPTLASGVTGEEKRKSKSENSWLVINSWVVVKIV